MCVIASLDGACVRKDEWLDPSLRVASAAGLRSPDNGSRSICPSTWIYAMVDAECDSPLRFHPFWMAIGRCPKTVSMSF